MGGYSPDDGIGSDWCSVVCQTEGKLRGPRKIPLAKSARI
jgi:hypothetical protein